MTQEHVKQLKKGDYVLVHGVVQEVDYEGDMLVLFKRTAGGEVVAWVSREDVGYTLAVPAAPKYDPCRRAEKAKKNSIPRVLRPTVTMPEADWENVSDAIYDHALHRLRVLVQEGHPDTEYLRGELEEIKKLTRLSDHIKRVNKNYCESMRGGNDDECPF